MSAALADDFYDDEESVYDEEFKPFPNQDDYFLGTHLGLQVDPVTHIRLLGKLDSKTTAELQAKVALRMQMQIQHPAGWDLTDKDRQYHPNGADFTRFVASWESQGIHEDKSFLKPLIPHEHAIDKLDITYLIGDCIGFHDDVQLTEEKNRGIIAILVNAPYGCQFITNEEHVTVGEVGGVYLLDDLYGHAVFPTQNIPVTDLARLKSDDGDRDREQFSQQVAMNFVLIANYYNDQYK